MQSKSISVDEVRKSVELNQPNLIFIIGKTCTGKSTFAKSLEDQDYKHIELDFVVVDSVVNKFKLSNRGKAFSVYKGIANPTWQKSFEEAARSLISNELIKSRIIVDAAVADPNVLRRIIPDEYKNNFALIYFHPFDIEFYYEGILNRFINDVKTKSRSFPIWDEMTEEILDDYKIYGEKGIKVLSLVKKYGGESAELSIERFEKFEKVFPEIILTGH